MIEGFSVSGASLDKIHSIGGAPGTCPLLRTSKNPENTEQHVVVVVVLLLLSRFSRVRLCATPEMAAHQAPPSLGFSRQEHWSGLPFPSPMQESEK